MINHPRSAPASLTRGSSVNKSVLLINPSAPAAFAAPPRPKIAVMEVKAGQGLEVVLLDLPSPAPDRSALARKGIDLPADPHEQHALDELMKVHGVGTTTEVEEILARGRRGVEWSRYYEEAPRSVSEEIIARVQGKATTK